MKVSFALADAGRQAVVELELPEGSRLADALARPEVKALLAGRDLASLAFGVWGKRCREDTLLREGDRVEVYRPLRADAKEMRRSRARLSASTRPRSAP